MDHIHDQLCQILEIFKMCSVGFVYLFITILRDARQNPIVQLMQLNGREALVANVAVTKRHQRLVEIRIIFTHTSSRSCFQKKPCHAMYALDT